MVLTHKHKWRNPSVDDFFGFRGSRPDDTQKKKNQSEENVYSLEYSPGLKLVTLSDDGGKTFFVKVEGKEVSSV